MSKRTIVAFFFLTAIAASQTWSTLPPGTFVDISTTGGTQLAGISDDSENNIVTTIGNALIPAGNLRIGNNGALAYGVTTGDISLTNATIATGTGIPTGFPTGTIAALAPYWDDLDTLTAGGTSIWWQENAGVLYIMWKDEGHFSDVAGQSITFEVQITDQQGCGGSTIQVIYPDTIFGGTQASFDNGASATIGYVTTAATGQANALFSFNTASVTSGSVLTLTTTINNNFVFKITSPLGPGSVQIDLADCSGLSTNYFIPYTFAPGVYPNGWVFGLDIPVSDLVNIWNSGYPFVGPLPQTIGPVTGLPSGLQFWMVAIGLNGFNNPTYRFGRQTYIIP